MNVIIPIKKLLIFVFIFVTKRVIFTWLARSEYAILSSKGSGEWEKTGGLGCCTSEIIEFRAEEAGPGLLTFASRFIWGWGILFGTFSTFFLRNEFWIFKLETSKSSE